MKRPASFSGIACVKKVHRLPYHSLCNHVVHRTNTNPNRDPNRSPAKRVRFGKGRRTQRMCSFRGVCANRGNGTELRSSDVVPVVGLEPTRHRWQRILSPPRLPFQHTGMRMVFYNSFGKKTRAKRSAKGKDRHFFFARRRKGPHPCREGRACGGAKREKCSNICSKWPIQATFPGL